MTTTVIRRGVHEVRDGVRLLRPDSDIPYRDGAEELLLEIVGGATDLSSESSEMLEIAEGWAQRYHTHPSRANILRALDIPPGAAVLEIGAGCGPITRYLGETGAIVDAVEPVFPRAAVGRQRTRDLPNVQVFCGSLDDVPTEPAYDIVVVVGVLEYVGSGSSDLAVYLDFLRACRLRLRPGGTLVLAIENKLGVKYLTGTGEDHSGRLYDSIEDYPRGSPARTFSATALVELVARSGFSPRLFSVFPDYKQARVVFDTARVQSTAPDLLENIPTFPSRSAGQRSLKLASEQRVWRELVRDGVAEHFANSFLVIGSCGSPANLWPTERLATYFSINRRRDYAATTSVVEVGDAIRFQRTYSPEPGPMIARGVTSWDYVRGESFLGAFYRSDEAGRCDLLERWIEIVEGARTGDTVSLDAIPTNLIVDDDGSLHLIDAEFHVIGSTDRVILRGLFWLGVHLTRDSPPEAWSPSRTVGEVVVQLGALAGVRIDDEAVDRFRSDEAAFQVAVTTHYLGAEATADAAAALQRMWEARVWDMPLGRRLHHDHDDAIAANEKLKAGHDMAVGQRTRLRARLRAMTAQRDRALDQQAKVSAARQTMHARLTASRRELAGFRRSRAHRAVEKLRRGVRRVSTAASSRR